MSAAPLIVAIDGPAGSGKTTLGHLLAGGLGLDFLDTGLIYRAVAYHLIRSGQPLDDVAAATRAADEVAVADLENPGLQDEAVSLGASRVAVIPEVRAAMLGFQRAFGDPIRGGVLVGRDIGTVVRPDASHKIFVTASLEERAIRRCKELQASGVETIYERVLQDLRERDARDRSRAASPLVPAQDAFVIDTTMQDVEAAFAIARAYVTGAG